jgi:hypothetical protein
LQEQARNTSTPTSAVASPDITRRDRNYSVRLNTVKGRGLPPPQLSHVHIHSDLLKQRSPSECTTNTTDDLEESVGSISAGNPNQDGCESGDEQDSGHYSPVSSTGLSPNDLGHSRNAASHMNDNVLQEAKINRNSRKGEQLELGDFYDRHLPLSRRDSFGKRESFGRMDSFGSKEEKSRRNSLEGKENLDRIDSFSLSGVRQGDIINGNGRSLSENKRGDAPSKKSCLSSPQVNIDDGELSSDTELSDDETSDVELDDDDEEEDGAVGWVPYRTSLEGAASLGQLRLSSESGLVRYVSANSIRKLHSDFDLMYYCVHSRSKISQTLQSSVAGPLMNFLQVDQQEKETKATKLSEKDIKAPKIVEKAKSTKLSAPTHTLSPPRKWQSEPDNDEKVHFVLRHWQHRHAQNSVHLYFPSSFASSACSPLRGFKAYGCN